MERYERSLLEILRREKIPGRQTIEPKIRSSAFPASVYIPGVPSNEREEDQQIELSTILDVEEEETKSPTLSVNDFLEGGLIRFSCSCGKLVKVKSKYAGRTGKCPKCKRRLEIPGGSTR
jgi:hypothetical protein